VETAPSSPRAPERAARQIQAVVFDYGGVLRRDERASAYDVIDTKFSLAPGALWWAFHDIPRRSRPVATALKAGASGWGSDRQRVSNLFWKVVAHVAGRTEPEAQRKYRLSVVRSSSNALAPSKKRREIAQKAARARWSKKKG
jgi:hypothetical protein